MIGIQAISTMFDINSFNSHGQNCTYGIEIKTLGLSLDTHPFFLPYHRLRWRSFESYILSHRSTLYWSMSMFFLYRRSIMYFLWLRFGRVIEVWIHTVSLVAKSLVSTSMDPQCIDQQTCFESICSNVVMPTSGMIYMYTIVFVLQLLSSFLNQHPHTYNSNLFHPSCFLLTS